MATKGWVPPLGPLSQLQREMDKLFDNVFGRTAARAGRLRPGYVYPPMTVHETDDAYVIRAELPGVAMEDLDLSATGEQLTVSGERPSDLPSDEVALLRRERDTGRFSRALTFPGPVDHDQCDATLKGGILTVRVAKAEEAKPRRIAVSVDAEPTSEEDQS